MKLFISRKGDAIHVIARAEGPDGIVGDYFEIIRPEDPRYGRLAEIAARTDVIDWSEFPSISQG